MTRRELKKFYCSVKESVIAAGFSQELLWVSNIAGAQFSEFDLLRESAWVILCSGFSEAVVRRRFSYISLCYCDWESAASIAKKGAVCIRAAKHGSGNAAKLAAIVRVAEIIVEEASASKATHRCGSDRSFEGVSDSLVR